MHDTLTQLGAIIKAARNSKKLTQMELSEELGITPRHLQAIENENKTPSYNLLFRMLSYLNISADTILHNPENNISSEQNQLLYLIKYKCDERDISVLLSTAKALIETKM